MLILRAVRWPMQSTCGFSIAVRTRSVGLRSNAACNDAITQSRSASTSSGSDSEPSIRMFTSMPLRIRNGFSRSLSTSISRSCSASVPRGWSVTA